MLLPLLLLLKTERPPLSLAKKAYLTSLFFVLFLWISRHSILYLSSRLYGRSLPIRGHNTQQFDPVREEFRYPIRNIRRESMFRSNFLEGLERDGASFAVYHKGQLVVNLYSGTSNTNTRKLWGETTRTPMFSTTKAVSSLCIALLVDRGLLDWNDPVAKYWPEYAVNGKENTTIQHLLSHQAGVPYIDEPISYHDALNVTRAINKIAQSKPLWIPGTKVRSTVIHA